MSVRRSTSFQGTPQMFITLCIKDARKNISKTARRRATGEKVTARRAGRAAMKASDLRNEYDGVVRPKYTNRDIG
jgi:hypothetical protein